MKLLGLLLVLWSVPTLAKTKIITLISETGTPINIEVDARQLKTKYGNFLYYLTSDTFQTIETSQVTLRLKNSKILFTKKDKKFFGIIPYESIKTIFKGNDMIPEFELWSQSYNIIPECIVEFHPNFKVKSLCAGKTTITAKNQNELTVKMSNLRFDQEGRLTDATSMPGTYDKRWDDFFPSVQGVSLAPPSSTRIYSISMRLFYDQLGNFRRVAAKIFAEERGVTSYSNQEMILNTQDKKSEKIYIWFNSGLTVSINEKNEISEAMVMNSPNNYYKDGYVADISTAYLGEDDSPLYYKGTPFLSFKTTGQSFVDFKSALINVCTKFKQPTVRSFKNSHFNDSLFINAILHDEMYHATSGHKIYDLLSGKKVKVKKHEKYQLIETLECPILKSEQKY